MVKTFLNFSCYSFLGVLSLSLSSCSIYKQHFDCPPPVGIPCASVTEIESLIVETEKGSDLILKPEVEEKNHCFWCGAQKADSSFPSNNSRCNQKIWICSQKNDDCLERGYYFQKSDSINSPIILEAEEVFSCRCVKQNKGN